jgi:hypothetical protein
MFGSSNINHIHKVDEYSFDEFTGRRNPLASLKANQMTKVEWNNNLWKHLRRLLPRWGEIEDVNS